MRYHVVVREVGLCLLVPLCCCKVACVTVSEVYHVVRAGSMLHTNDKRVLWELFEEALLRRSVDVEVQSLCLAGQQCQTGY